MSIQTENRLSLLEAMVKDIEKRLSEMEENSVQTITLKAIKDDLQGLKMRMGKREVATT